MTSIPSHAQKKTWTPPIPWNSEKILKREILTLVPNSDPILRKKTARVKYPLSDEDQQIIENMLYSIEKGSLALINACYEEAAGMAANQWGIDKSIFLYCPYGNIQGPIEVIINPEYEVLSDEKDEGWEGCFSVPFTTASVSRNLHIKVKYQDQQGTVIQKELHDWEARVWQHENNHLMGILMDNPLHGCKEEKKFKDKASMDEFYNKVREERKKQ